MKKPLLASLLAFFTLSLTAQINTFPHTEGFENGGSIPTGWTNEYVSGASNWQFTTTNFSGAVSARTGTYLARFYVGSYAGNETRLVTPQIDLSSLAGPGAQLNFWYTQQDWGGDQDELRIYYKTSAAGAWNLLGTYTSSISTWTEVTLSLPSPTSDYYIAFQGYSGYGYGVTVDDVVIQAAPSCLAPSALNASNQTTSTADLDWTENGTATEWEIEYGSTGFSQGSGTSGYVWNTPDTTIPGLMAGTTYDYYVRSICAPGDTSGWVGPFSFTTAYGPTSSCGLGIFFGTSPSTLPIDIEVSGAPGTQLGTDVIVGNFDIIIDHIYDGDVEIYLTSPNGVTVNLSVANGGGGDDYGDPTNCPTDVTSFQDGQPPITGGSPPYIGSFAPEQPLSNFNDGSDPNGTWTLTIVDNFPAFDDGTLEYFSLNLIPPPTCDPPNTLGASNLTTTSADLDWVEPGSAIEWQIELGPTGFSQGTGTYGSVFNLPDTTWGGLMAGTTYDYYVRSVCGVGDTSTWAGPFTFTTVYGPTSACNLGLFFGTSPSTLPVDFVVAGAPGTQLGVDVVVGNFDVIIDHVYDGDVEIYLTSPNGVTVNLSVANGGSGADYGDPTNCPTDVTSFQDGQAPITGGSPPFIGSFAPEQPLSNFNDGSDPNGTWTLTLVDNFPAFDDGTLEYFSLNLIPPPTCDPPTNLNASNQTLTSADLDWVEPASATEWQVELGLTGFSQGTGTYGSVFNLPDTTWGGLMSGTTYDYYVRSVCGVGDTSTWTGPFSFTTAFGSTSSCGVGLPIPDAGAPSTCLDVNFTVSGAPGTQLGTDVLVEYFDIIIDHTFDADLDFTLTSPNGVTVDLSSDNGGAGDDFGDPTTCPTDVTRFMDGEAPVTGGAAPFIGMFEPEQLLASFYDNSDPNGVWTLTICDDAGGDLGTLEYFSLNLIAPPTCPGPTALDATLTSTSSVDLDWLETGPATNWEIEYGLSGFGQGTGTTGYVYNTPDTSISGLMGQTTYDYYVRSICGINDTSNWEGPFSFTTPYLATSSCGIGLPIPDNGASTSNCLEVPIFVSGAPGNALGTNVSLAGLDIIIDHSWDSDLEISLTSPNGVTIDISSDNGGSGDDYGDPTNCPDDVTRFRQGGTSVIGSSAPFIGTYGPEQSFALFNDGSDPNGTWTLTICDDAGGDVGTLEYFSLSLGQHVWTGSTSTAWNDVSNWSLGAIPSSYCSELDVFVPGGLPNNPAINIFVDVANAEIEQGASLTIDPAGRLTVCGNFTHNGGNSIGPGVLSFNNVPGILTTMISGDFEAGIMRVGTDAGRPATLAPGTAIRIDSMLHLTNLTGQLVIPSTASVTLTSDADGTAYLDDFSAPNFGLVGNLIMERLVRNTGAGAGFYFLSNPIQNPHVADWRDDFNTNGSIYGIDQGPNSLNGRKVIPLAACLVDSLSPHSPYGGLFSFIESAVTSCILDAWHVKSNGSLVPGMGYAGIVPDGVTIEVEGVPNSGNVNVPITRTGSNTAQPGLNTVGNPYMSPIDWAQVVTDNIGLISGSAYFWQSTGYYSGVTLPFNMMVSGDIPSSQGFQVEALASGNLQFNNGQRVAGNPAFQRSAPLYDQRLDLIVEGNGFADIAYITFSGIATDGWDDLYDSRKGTANSFQPKVWTKLAAEEISINSFDQFTGMEVIDLEMEPGTSGSYTIRAEQMETFDATTLVFLKDKQLNIEHCFNFDGDYTFSSQVGDSPSRFEVYFNPAIEPATTKADCENLNGSVSFDLGWVTWDSYELIDDQGNVVQNGTQVSGPINHNNLNSGQYTLEVSYNGNTISLPVEIDASSPVSALYATSSTVYEVGEPIQFNNASVGASGYVWNFGDGTLLQGISDPIYSFNNEGSYLVELESTNDDCADYYSSWITISNKATGINDLIDGILVKAYSVGQEIVIDFSRIADEDMDIRLYDLAGALVIDGGEHRDDTRIKADVAPGIYIIEITGTDSKVSRKLPIGL